MIPTRTLGYVALILNVFTLFVAIWALIYWAIAFQVFAMSLSIKMLYKIK